MSARTAEIVNRPLYETFADNLRRCMDGAHVDVAELARRTGVPAERIEGILGVTTEVLLPELARFTHCLGVDISDLLPAELP